MQENNVVALAGDTDSTHLKSKDVELVIRKYKEKYGTDLVPMEGEASLGQFHSDLSIDGCTDVHSIKSRYLSPKCYIEVLSGINKSGEEVLDLKMCLKGVSKKALNFEILKRQKKALSEGRIISREDIAIEMYGDINTPKGVKFVLNPSSGVVSFEFVEGYGCVTRKCGDFVREVSTYRAKCRYAGIVKKEVDRVLKKINKNKVKEESKIVKEENLVMKDISLYKINSRTERNGRINIIMDPDWLRDQSKVKISCP